MRHWQNLPASALEGDLAASWDALNTERSDLPFLSAYVITAALRMFGSGQERLLVGSDAQGPAAMLILGRKRFFEWQTFQPSQIPLGAWVARKDLRLIEIARSVQRSLPGFCLVLSITQVDPRLAPRDADTSDSLTTDYIDTAWVEIEGHFADYWNSRGKNLRKTMKRQRAKLADQGVVAVVKCLTKSVEMADAVVCYGDLESRGWKAQQGTAVHHQNSQGVFYTEILENACLRNEGLVYQYFFGDHVVAMNLCLVRGVTLIVLKTTYDETITSFSPAFLLRQETLELLFNEGCIKRMELFGKVMEWHARWTDKRRTIYHLTVFRWGGLKTLRSGLKILRSGLQRAWRGVQKFPSGVKVIHD
ncbi:MAG: GNAT family N-acetyltransferase [Candidatus Competibacteraceae bacterium]